MRNAQWQESDIDDANEDLNYIGNDAKEMQELCDDIIQLCKACKTGSEIEKRAQEIKDLMEDFEILQDHIRMAVDDFSDNFGVNQ